MNIKNIMLILLIYVSIISAQTKSEHIDDLLTRYQEYGLLNASVLVAENGKVIFSKGYGFANMEYDIPNSENTVHRIGSITKQFTATIIMQLVEEGKIKLDEKMITYLNNYRKDTGDKITVKNLLTHTSGIPNYTNYPGFWSDSSRTPYSTDELIEKFCSGDLEFEPSSQYSYCNSGFVLLAKIIEEVTDISFEENIQSRIFDKIGMKNSYLERSEQIIKNRAAGYDKRGASFVNTRYMDVKNAFGAGDIASTVKDLYLWDQALYTEKIISVESKKKMFTPFLSNYGFGWGIDLIEHPAGGDSLTLYSHGGGINGFNAHISRAIDDKILIVGLNNTGGAPWGEIRKNITKILYGKDYDYPKKPIGQHLANIIDEDGIEEAVAAYKEISEFEKETFNLRENELNNLGYSLLGEDKIEEAVAIFQLNVDAYPESFNVYDSMGEALMIKGDNEKSIKFYKKSVELNPQNEGGYVNLKKLGVEIDKPKDANVSLEVLKKYVGEYNLFPGFNLVVTVEYNNLFTQATGQPKFQIFPETETKFYLKVVNAKVEFIVESDGSVNKIILFQGGQEVPGKRIAE